MQSARRQWALGAVTGWYATAARALAVVLALIVAVPTVGLAEDFSFHQGRHGHERTDLSASWEAASGGAQAADPGSNCHVHCGCHVAVPLDGTVTVTPAAVSRPNYAPVADTVFSIFHELLPRPPRA